MAVMVAAAAAGRPAAAVAGADEFIASLGTRTVAVLSDTGLDQPAKLARIVTMLDQSIDLPLLARLVLGRHWRECTEAQRTAYVDLFRRLVVKIMAERLSRYGGETFELIGTRAADERDTVVQTRIYGPAKSWTYDVDWRVRQTGERFVVVDVVAEGISMVVTQRSEASEIVAQRGIDGLLATMRERLAQQA
jgi:phospholipid transport system substrate-binding protein